MGAACSHRRVIGAGEAGEEMTASGQLAALGGVRKLPGISWCPSTYVLYREPPDDVGADPVIRGVGLRWLSPPDVYICSDAAYSPLHTTCSHSKCVATASVAA